MEKQKERDSERGHAKGKEKDKGEEAARNTLNEERRNTLAKAGCEVRA